MSWRRRRGELNGGYGVMIPGPGIPGGGPAGYLLAKATAIPYDTEWISPTAFTQGILDYVNEQLSNLTVEYAPFAHDHDDNYAALGHDHDERYYTEDEVDALIAAVEGGGLYAPLVHDHDDLYYTEAEIDALFAGFEGGGGGGLTAIQTVATTTYTLDADDDLTHILFTHASGCTVTVPKNATLALDPLYRVRMTAAGGTVTLVGEDGTVNLNSRGDALQSAGQDAVFEVEKIGTNDWNVLGDVTDGSVGSIGATEWALNFQSAGDAYIPASDAMTVNTGITAIGTGTISYAKSTAASPTVFNSATMPITLEAGAWLKVTAASITGFVTAHIVRTA